jgi:CubicO group peptidase (beta-lactamase class C family)
MKFIAFQLITLLLLLQNSLSAQLYFPPNNPTTWDTLSPSALNWCPDKIEDLYTLLESNGTRSFIILKDGKIVLEKYFGNHGPLTPWYWASAGKSLTAFMVGIAQQEGALSISDPSSDYLGTGWTSCTSEQEAAITVRHQLTMTTGLDFGSNSADCTADSCLLYLAEPGSRWSYHNGPYTLLDGVIENATGMSLNAYTDQKLESITGMTGSFLMVESNNVFFSNTRSMARYGLLILNQGNWNGTQIMTDQNYFNAMVNTSQDLNKSYGYLWWLNGKESFMVPGSQLVIPGPINPDAPEDMIMALGKNGQFINVVPSQNIVLIRMGDSPDNSLVPFLFNNDIWAAVNELECAPVATTELAPQGRILVSPNPTDGFTKVELPETSKGAEIRIYSSEGVLLQTYETAERVFKVDWSRFSRGLYVLDARVGGERFLERVLRM